MIMAGGSSEAHGRCGYHDAEEAFGGGGGSSGDDEDFVGADNSQLQPLYEYECENGLDLRYPEQQQLKGEENFDHRPDVLHARYERWSVYEGNDIDRESNKHGNRRRSRHRQYERLEGGRRPPNKPPPLQRPRRKPRIVAYCQRCCTFCCVALSMVVAALVLVPVAIEEYQRHLHRQVRVLEQKIQRETLHHEMTSQLRVTTVTTTTAKMFLEPLPSDFDFETNCAATAPAGARNYCEELCAPAAECCNLPPTGPTWNRSCLRGNERVCLDYLMSCHTVFEPRQQAQSTTTSAIATRNSAFSATPAAADAEKALYLVPSAPEDLSESCSYERIRSSPGALGTCKEACVPNRCCWDPNLTFSDPSCLAHQLQPGACNEYSPCLHLRVYEKEMEEQQPSNYGGRDDRTIEREPVDSPWESASAGNRGDEMARIAMTRTGKTWVRPKTRRKAQEEATKPNMWTKTTTTTTTTKTTEMMSNTITQRNGLEHDGIELDYNAVELGEDEELQAEGAKRKLEQKGTDKKSR